MRAITKTKQSKFRKWWNSWGIEWLPVNDTPTAQLSPESGLNDEYIFDFKKGWQSGWGNTSSGFVTVPTDSSGNEGSVGEEPKTQFKIVKPIDVLHELETVPRPIDLDDLDKKIEILKIKKDLVKQEYTKREMDALVERLENRKQYAENREFFEQFQNTDEFKIERLCNTHRLVMKESDIFIPEFPDEAILIMKEYTEQVEAITGKKTVFYVIATKEDFRDADDKRDPILLAQSPFGFFYQILGAWDKEMILLNEL
jgi:hypothetical protein